MTNDEGRRTPPPESVDVPPSSKLLAYLELVRAPNLFTAMADVLMGFLVTHASVGLEEGWVLAALLGASALLYAGGVALNDVFDVEADRQMRPGRPLPSGRVSLAAARALGWELLLVGAALGWLAGHLSGRARPGLVATGLAGCVVLYDAWLKRTPLGPLAMGGCRMLNVLLGMSAAAEAWETYHLAAAAGIGAYIAGLTWFARTEARPSSRTHLALAVVVMGMGIGLLAWFPTQTHLAQPLIRTEPGVWFLMIGVLGVLIARPCLRAIIDPGPQRVQLAVQQCILSLIILDAVACYAVRGTTAAMAVVSLLVPTVVLGRWVYST